MASEVCQRIGNPNNRGFCLVLCIQVCNNDSSGLNFDQGILMTPFRDDENSSKTKAMRGLDCEMKGAVE